MPGNYTFLEQSAAANPPQQFLLNFFGFLWDLVVNKLLFSWWFWQFFVIGIILFIIFSIAARPYNYRGAKYD